MSLHALLPAPTKPLALDGPRPLLQPDQDEQGDGMEEDVEIMDGEQAAPAGEP